jgi:hypothetical protein
MVTYNAHMFNMDAPCIFHIRKVLLLYWDVSFVCLNSRVVPQLAAQIAAPRLFGNNQGDIG